MHLSNEQLHSSIFVVVVLLCDSMKMKALPPDNCQEVVFPVSEVLDVCSFALALFVLVCICVVFDAVDLYVFLGLCNVLQRKQKSDGQKY